MNMNNKEIIISLNKIKFHEYNAKSSGESLLIHSYNTYFIVSQLARFIPNITAEDKEKLEIGALLHDYGKTYPEYQKKLNGAHKLKDSDIAKVKEMIKEIKSFPNRELDDIIYMIQNHHGIDLKKVNSNLDKLTRIVSICDNLVSNREITLEAVHIINGLIDDTKYECFSVELIEHPISSYAIGAFDYIYKENNITPILFAKNGTLFIRQKDQNIPSLDEVNNYFNEQVNGLFGNGCLIFERTNNRIYVSPTIFLALASNENKFIETVKSDVEERLRKFKKYQKDKWNSEKEKVFLLGRVCGGVHDSIIKCCNISDKLCAKGGGGFANKDTVKFIEKNYGENKSYLVILKIILQKYNTQITGSLKTSSYDLKELLSFDSSNSNQINLQEDAKKDYEKYWNKNPIEVCRACHNFSQDTAPAVLFPQSDLGGTTDVFYTDFMRTLPEFKESGGVCRWCLIWFLLLKNKTGNKLYKLCVFPHSLFGRIDWTDFFESQDIVMIGDNPENYVQPHVAVLGLSGIRQADLISQVVKNKILHKLYENGLRGKIISTLVEPSLYLFDFGSAKISVNEYPLFRQVLENINQGRGGNTYASAIKSLKSNEYSWGHLIKIGKIKNDPKNREVVEMVSNLGEVTGLIFLKNIWVGGKPENRVSNAEKIVRRMNETLRKLKDKENKDFVVDSMIAIGRKIAISTRELRDWADERRQKEIDSLKLMAEKLYEYRDKGAQRTELVRAMACYLGYIPSYVGGEKT